METNDTDRRARGIKRVDYSTLVEICGREPGIPAFEAEAVELSGRGMQVKTRYLPELNAPLVLRFEHDGKEALVEGEVAWRKEMGKGGEFGIKFTALDSNSVRVLREVCSPQPASPGEAAPKHEAPPGTKSSATQSSGTKPPATKSPGARPSEAQPSGANATDLGVPVRLHIHGLAAPMKARVFESRGRRVHVGSQLEFLKVGRALELENMDAGGRRAAEIDSVTVAIDPQTQIPQLVVSLCYDGADDEDDDETPEPSVVAKDGTSAGRFRANRSAAKDEALDDRDDDFHDEDEESEDLFKGRFATWATAAGTAMKGASAGVARVAGSTAGGLRNALRLAARTASERSAAGEPKRKGPRRTTRAASSVGIAARGGVARTSVKDRPRAQRHSRGKIEEPKQGRWRNPKTWALLAALVAGASGAYPIFFAAKPHPVDSNVALKGLPPTSGAQLPAAGLPGAGSAFPAPATLSIEQQAAAAAAGGAVTANVPLFGPQALATTEAAPLTPAPQHIIDELSMAKDQTFARPVVPQLGKAEPTEQGSAEADDTAATGGDTVFQVGRMHLPIVHRLRLDAEGSALQGSKTPSGFSVLVPGRKVMESGATIAKRDDRILSVNVKNTPAGGTVVFRFRKDIPGYKARLRNDYVEFFINSEEK